MRIVLIGGAGFIGTNIALSLKKQGYDVLVLDREEANQTRLTKHGIAFQTCDYLSGQNIEDTLERGDCVVHLASTSLPNLSNQNIYKDAQENILASIQLFESCVKRKVSKIIYSSSGGQVYGIPESVPLNEHHATNPTSAYGIHKLAVEKYLLLFSKLYGIDSLILRIANPYGPGQLPFRGQGVVATFIASAYLGKEVEIWGDGRAIRDYIYITDLTEAFVKAICYQGKEQIFNIGSGIGTSVLDILNAVETATGKEIVRTFIKAKTSDVSVNVLDCNKAYEELHWKQHISLSDGIKQMTQYWNVQMNDFVYE